MPPVICAVAMMLAVLLWPARAGVVLGGPGRLRQAGRNDLRTTVFDLADSLTLLALALRSGTGPLAALDHVAVVASGPIREHLQSVAAAGRWGVDHERMWDYAPPAWEPARTAWRIAVVAGAPPADLLERAADRIRESEVRRLEAASGRAGSLLVLPLGCAFLPAFACTTVIPAVAALASSVVRT
jgi:Flp pilus assembly protein TadB